jgi:hypothetical protein
MSCPPSSTTWCRCSTPTVSPARMSTSYRGRVCARAY